MMKAIFAPLLILFAVTACGEGAVDYSAERDPDLIVPPPKLAAMEQCFGIAPAGKGHGPDGPDTSQVDFQGDAWTFVKAGTCVQTVVAGGRKGALKPLWRDRPVGPWTTDEGKRAMAAAQMAEAKSDLGAPDGD